MVHVLKTITSACSGDGASPSPELLEHALDALGVVRVHLAAERGDVVAAHEGQQGRANVPTVGRVYGRLRMEMGRGGAALPSTARDSRITVTLTWPGYSRLSSISRAISCERSSPRVVVDLGRLDDHPDLPARLERVDALDPLCASASSSRAVKPLDVALEALAARARARGRDRVGGDQQHGLDRLRLHLVVVRLDRVHDALRLAVAAREVRPRCARASPRPRASSPCRGRGAARRA